MLGIINKRPVKLQKIPIGSDLRFLGRQTWFDAKGEAKTQKSEKYKQQSLSFTIERKLNYKFFSTLILLAIVFPAMGQSLLTYKKINDFEPGQVTTNSPWTCVLVSELLISWTVSHTVLTPFLSFAIIMVRHWVTPILSVLKT